MPIDNLHNAFTNMTMDIDSHSSPSNPILYQNPIPWEDLINWDGPDGHTAGLAPLGTTECYFTKEDVSMQEASHEMLRTEHVPQQRPDNLTFKFTNGFQCRPDQAHLFRNVHLMGKTLVQEPDVDVVGKAVPLRICLAESQQTHPDVRKQLKMALEARLNLAALLERGGVSIRFFHHFADQKSYVEEKKILEDRLNLAALLTRGGFSIKLVHHFADQKSYMEGKQALEARLNDWDTKASPPHSALRKRQLTPGTPAGPEKRSRKTKTSVCSTDESGGDGDEPTVNPPKMHTNKGRPRKISRLKKKLYGAGYFVVEKATSIKPESSRKLKWASSRACNAHLSGQSTTSAGSAQDIVLGTGLTRGNAAGPATSPEGLLTRRDLSFTIPKRQRKE